MTKPTIKFTFHGVKVDGKLFTAYISGGADKSKHHSTGTGPFVSFSIKSYECIPAGAAALLGVKNRTDLMSDYFDNDHFTVTPASPYWAAAAAAFIAHETAAVARYTKRAAKSGTAYSARELANVNHNLDEFKAVVAALAPRPQYAGAGPLAEPATVAEVLAALEPDPRAYEGTPVYSWGRDLPEPTDTDEAPDWAAFV